MSSTRRPVRALKVLALLVALLALVAAGCTGSADVARRDLGALTGSARPSGDGWGLLHQGRASEALEVFTQAPEEDVWSLYGRGEAAYLTGDYNGALEAHAQVVERAAGRPVAAWSLLRLEELRGLSDGFAARIAPTLEAVAAAERRPEGAPTMLTRALARRLGLLEASRRWSEGQAQGPLDGSAQGVPTRWRVVGPTNLHELLSIDEVTAPERDEAMGEVYALLGFERRAQEINTEGLTVQVSEQVRASGVVVAETWLTLASEASFELHGEFPGTAIVLIDGREVLRRDERQRVGAMRVRTRGLRLGAGRHRVVVRLASELNYKDRFGLVFVPEDAEIKTVFTPERPGGADGRVLDAGATVPWLGEHLDVGLTRGEPTWQAMVAQMAIAAHDEAVARGALSMLEAEAPDSVLLAMLQAELASSLWTLPGGIRQRDTLVVLRRALERDPGAHRARLWLASAMRGQGLKEAAGELVEALLAARPDQSAHWLEAARYYEWRGFGPRAERALEEAARLDPGDCYTRWKLYIAHRQRHHTMTPDEAPQLEACPGTRQALGRDLHLVGRGESGPLLVELESSLARRPDLSARWVELARAVRAERGDEAALEVIERGLGRFAFHVELVELKAEILERAGREQEAEALLVAALEAEPGSQGLRRRLALRRGKLPFEELLADGLGAIKEFDPARVGALNASALYVLDYMARRYFEDGSSADVTHIVIKVLSKEGINDFGEVSFPDGAVPLMVRTVKAADGSVVEAQFQQGKETLSMPALEAGDYIEYAYLQWNGRNIARQGAMIGPTFYFQMSKIASAHSEFVLEVPEAWALTEVRRNEPPEAQITTQGGLRRYRYLRQWSSQPRPEPNRVPDAEFLPHVASIHRYGWEDSHRLFQNRLAGARALTPLLEARAAEVTAGIEGQEAQARALFRFVGQHVRQRAFRDFSTPAAHIEQSAEGNPVVLLQALLRAVGVESEVMVIKGRMVDPVETAIPDINSFGFVALRAKVAGQEVWLNPSGPNAPWGVLPEAFQEVDALSLEPGAGLERIQTPAWDPALSRRELTMEMALEADGTLVGEVVEVLRGARGHGRRNGYDELVDPDAMRKFLERLLNSDISGAELLEHRIEGREDPEADLVLRMKFRRPGYAQPGPGGSLVVADRYDLPNMTQRFARLPQRTSALLLSGRYDEQVVVTLTVPEGMTLEGPGGDDQVEYVTEFGSYDRAVERTERGLKLTQRLVVPIQRIAPERYEDFVRWSGQLDRASYVNFVITGKPR